MKYFGALLVERMILESLVRVDKDLLGLAEDTGLNENLLKIMLQDMLSKGWISYERGSYSLKVNNNCDWINEINHRENKEYEVKELMDSMVSSHFKEGQEGGGTLIRVQKLELTNDEEILLNSHLKALEMFFKNIRESRAKKPLSGLTKNQKIVVWGAGVYQDLVGTNLVAV